MASLTTSVEQLEGNKVKLSVAVPAAEFEKAVDAAINAAPKGFPALRRLLDNQLPALLTRLPSFLDDFIKHGLVEHGDYL